MAAPLLKRRVVLSNAFGTEGTAPTWSNVETAANSNVLIYDPQVTYEVGRVQRAPVRAQVGTLTSVNTTETATLTFTCELKGSGTAGTAPSIGKLLQACSMDETVNTGTASIGTVIKQPNSTGSGAAPTVAGTFTGTKSGLLLITLETVTTDTSIAFVATFYPGDGTAPSSDTFTQSSDTAVTLTGVAAGVTVDFGDPSSSTTGYVAGDNYAVALVSDQQVDVVYTNRDPDGTSSDKVVDLSYNQDGRIHRLYSCRGTWEITGTVGDIAKIQFTMTGIPATVADVALVTGIDFEDTIPVAFMNLGSTDILGGAGCFSAVTITQGNTLANRQCATATKGIESIRVVSRAMTGNIDPEADLVANFDSYGLMRGVTENALDFQIGSTSGNIVLFEAPNVQIVNIADTSREDILVDGIDLQFNQPEYDAGGAYSECSLTFK